MPSNGWILFCSHRSYRTRSDIDTEHTRLLCFSGDGFTDELQSRAANSAEVQLIDLERLYHGS
ncbi:MAG: hypothetical protein ACREN8_04810 [Candidatus Dormibacteraceae bacterium]